MSDLILGALIGASAVLAANAIGRVGNWRTSKKAEELWRRDHRRTAYAELVRASDRFQRCAEEVYQNEKYATSGLTVTELSAQLDDAMKGLDHAASQVQLLGSL